MPHIVTLPNALVRYVAANLIPNWYLFYHLFKVPPRKSADAVDAKIQDKYATELTKSQRRQLRKLGIAQVRYVRCGRTCLLFATHGVHAVFQEEKMTSMRQQTLKLYGYSITEKNGHPSVRIERKAYTRIRKFVRKNAHRFPLTFWERYFSQFPFDPYCAVKRQVFSLRKLLNLERAAHGRTQMEYRHLRLMQRPYRIFRK